MGFEDLEDVDASCNQCGHEFDQEELVSAAFSGKCPACGCGFSGDIVDKGSSTNRPFSYDPNQDFKTEP